MRERWRWVFWPVLTWLAAVGAAVAAAPAWWGRQATTALALLGDRWPVAAFLAAATASAVMWRRTRRRTDTEAPVRVAREPRWLWLLSDRGIAAAVVAVAGLGMAAMVVLLDVASGATGNELAKLKVESIKYGLGAIATAGAAAALLLAVRRQRHAERAQDHLERDAAERQVTELYTNAVEQLGHAEAPVRLGGLYALERVGQNNPDQRQTIVDVICAYLRMPYTPPSGAPGTGNDAGSGPAADTESVAATGAGGQPGWDPEQERQVRLTAERILTGHLRPPEGLSAGGVATLTATPTMAFWPDIDLDLSGATLLAWNMTESRIRTADFQSAMFTGDAGFGGTTFTRDAGFGGTTFTRDAGFGGTTFTGHAWFHEATFTRDARFKEATFTRDAWFHEATFTRNARFHEATFNGNAWFDGATFNGNARFDGATFTRDGWFDLARVAASRSRTDIWPLGWREMPNPEDPQWLRLVKERPSAEDASQSG